MARKKAQTEIPGTERPKDEELSAAAQDLADAGGTLSEAHKRRDETADRLIELMRKKGVTTYVDEDAKIRVDLRTGADKVRVTRLEKTEAAVDEAAE